MKMITAIFFFCLCSIGVSQNKNEKIIGFVIHSKYYLNMISISGLIDSNMKIVRTTEFGEDTVYCRLLILNGVNCDSITIKPMYSIDYLSWGDSIFCSKKYLDTFNLYNGIDTIYRQIEFKLPEAEHNELKKRFMPGGDY